MMKRLYLLLLFILPLGSCRYFHKSDPRFDALKPAMIEVKGGDFKMGGNVNPDEAPVHEVAVNDFQLCAHEVTLDEFRQFVHSTAYKTDAEKKGYSWIFDGKFHTKEGVTWECDAAGIKRDPKKYNYPVVHISWNDAQAYCRWLSAQTHKHFRLPSEAEWEYAARGGRDQKTFTYSGSDNIDSVAWYLDNRNWSVQPVEKKKSNSLGIFDMSGNVWEWCQDYYSATYYAESPQQSPKGPSSGTNRVLRGGSWNYGPIRSRIACRDGSGVPDMGYYNVGFRVAADE